MGEQGQLIKMSVVLFVYVNINNLILKNPFVSSLFLNDLLLRYKMFLSELFYLELCFFCFFLLMKEKLRHQENFSVIYYKGGILRCYIRCYIPVSSFGSLPICIPIPALYADIPNLYAKLSCC